jgi:hypothetical protein
VKREIDFQVFIDFNFFIWFFFFNDSF